MACPDGFLYASPARWLVLTAFFRVVSVLYFALARWLVLKDRIHTKIFVPPSQQRLVFKGRELLDGEALAVLDLQDFDSVVLLLRLRGGGGSENPYIAVDHEGATTTTCSDGLSRRLVPTVTPSVAKAPANTQSLLSQLQQEQRAQCRMQVMFKAALSSAHNEMRLLQAKLKEQQKNTAELKKQAVEQQEKYAELKTQADEQLQENAEQKVLILQLQHQMKDIKAIVAR